MMKHMRTLLALSLFVVSAPLVGTVHAQTPTPPGVCPPGEFIINNYCYTDTNGIYNPAGAEAPEIHLSSSIGGIVLLFGGMMVLRGRKAQQQS